MSRRFASALALIAAFGLLASGCGGGDDSSAGSGDSGSTPASGDVKSILSGITATDTNEPTKVGLTITADLKGTIKDPQVGLVLDGSPITLDLSGPVGKDGKNADLAFNVAAGKIKLKGAIRIIDGTDGFIQVADKWYKLPPGTLSETSSASNIDTKKLLDALGDPSELLDDPKVEGAEKIDGITSDHVSGDIDTKSLIEALGRVAAASGDAGPIGEDEITEAVNQVDKYIKAARLNLWVGQKDKQIHKLSLDVTAVLDDATKEQSGIEGADVSLTISATPTDEPSVEEPEGALPSDQLQKDIGGIILSGLAQP